jgi:hypothetical protein
LNVITELIGFHRLRFLLTFGLLRKRVTFTCMMLDECIV